MGAMSAVKSTRVVLADSFKFYLQAHNYHWNVEGMFFQPLHVLFSDIYNEVWPQLDRVAEHIRAMDGYAPGTMTLFNELSSIRDENFNLLTGKEMCSRLLSTNDIVLKSIRDCFDAAVKEGNEALANLMAERQEAHQKHAWQLRATIK
jgi:starvation-inducible DNA-binding protein